MSIAEILIASSFVLLAVAHSALGETGLLKPLFAAQWELEETPRWAAIKIFRFAWHLTSITWLAIAAVVLGVDLMTTIAIMSLVSAALIFVMLRGHLAWPIFLIGGLAALYQGEVLTAPALEAAAIATMVVLLAASALHVYWASGGTWMLDRAVPDLGEGSDFAPGHLMTLAVAGALAAFAGLVGATAFADPPAPVRWLTIAGVVVLALRAVGDTKVAGFTKSVRDTAFAKADDRYFTPLIVFLALGATAALL